MIVSLKRNKSHCVTRKKIGYKHAKSHTKLIVDKKFCLNSSHRISTLTRDKSKPNKQSKIKNKNQKNESNHEINTISPSLQYRSIHRNTKWPNRVNSVQTTTCFKHALAGLLL